jgi:tetratricopeptide (TPR) repeat protein
MIRRLSLAMVDRTAIPGDEPYFDLGSFHRSISTSNRDAQIWFDRGLTLCWSFQQDEAKICFEQTLAHDPDCVMGYWGLAVSQGIEYNKSWEIVPPGDLESMLPKIKDAIDKAQEKRQYGSAVENALIEAAAARLPSDFKSRDFVSWNTAYADAMKVVYVQYGEDLDIAALYAESMMLLSPWKMWDLKTGRPTALSRADNVKIVLEKALKRDEAYEHPGLLHLYVHLMEMSPSPELAIPAADRLIGLVPAAGHLNHMPSHLDILIGDYRRAIYANTRAIIADKMFSATGGFKGFYLIYHLHNINTLVYAAMLSGQYKVAIRYAELAEQTMPKEMVQHLGHIVESLYRVKIHVFVRFGRWQEIIAVELPEPQSLFPLTTAYTLFAKGVAYSATRDISNAERHRELYVSALDRVPPGHLIFPNKATDVLAIGTAMLDGELEYRKGNFEAAFKHLRLSIERYDGIGFGEPWGWMQPVRHAYAALKIERGELEEALSTYAADLGYNGSLPRAVQHPNNVWALHGYHECLMKLGRKDEAAIIQPQLRLALAVADVDISSSCFCRLETDDRVVVNGEKCC